MNMFKKATKTEAKLRLAIAGPSGSGKTYSALAIATALGGPIALLDTEHRSASKYADIFAFDVLELDAPYHPDRFVEAIQGAAQAGYKVVILDSMTHAWNGEGGLLDIVEQIAKRMKSANSFAAWKDATPIQNRFIEALLSADLHIIGTMRSKQDYVQERNDKGNTVIRKVGMAPIQRDGFEYEFDVFLDMDIDNNAIVSKTRCPSLAGKVVNKPGEQVAKVLTEWLKGAPVQAKQQQPISSPKPSTRGNRTVDAITGEILEPVTNGNGKHDNPFGDTEQPYYVAAWQKLTGKHYDLVNWVRQLHLKNGGPCSKAQYGLVTGIVDALTHNEHNYALSVLCQAEISKANMPSKDAASALLKFLQKEINAVDENGNEIKGDNGKPVKVPNPQYRQDMADMITEIAAQMEKLENVELALEPELAF